MNRLKLISFFLLGVISITTQANEDLLSSALNGFCFGKSKYVLQSTSIFTSENHDLHEFNYEAVSNLYKNNTRSEPIKFSCGGILVKSKEDIELGFQNKPKGVVSFYTSESWVGFHEKYPNIDGVIAISIPGYSSDRKFAVLYMDTSCDVFCGYVNFIQYRIVDGRWEIDKTVLVSQR